MNDVEKTVATTGAGFADDGLPLSDIKEDAAPPFVEQDGAIYLCGSRSSSSGSLAFPVREVCLETGARDMEPHMFGPDGVLYSYSEIHVSPSRAVPYTLGYVDFPNGVRVLARVEASDAGVPIACDQPVQLRAQGAEWFVVPVATPGE